jgi:CTP:molybdopterin cytidylyltransferase MocA
MLTAAILAAGESRRMGSPKALATIYGKTFVQHLLDATRHPRIGLTRIVLGANAEDIRSQLNVAEELIVVNDEWEKGQLSSIQAAIRSLPDAATEGLILCPVDHPLISADLVGNLIAEFDSSRKKIVLPTFRGRRGHPVLFHSTLFVELLEASPEIGAREVVWAHDNDILEVATEEEGVILNLNNPESLRNAQEKKTAP